MIQKIIVIILLIFTSLFSADITGKWQMDMAKMQETYPMEKIEKSKQLVVALFAHAWNEVKFAPDGTFSLPKGKQGGIWKKSEESYIIQASTKAPVNRLTILDTRHMKIVFDDPKLAVHTFYFLRQKR